MPRAVLKRYRPWHFEEPLINLTALIDVVFVILIMFIVIAPLLEMDRVELAESPAENGSNAIAAQEQSPISIHVLADNTIQYNHQVVSIGQLEKLLKRDKARYPGVRPQVFHDRRASFGTYQSIKNNIESAGFEQMDIVLKPG